MATAPTFIMTQHRGAAAPGIFRLAGGTTIGSVLTSAFGTNENAINSIYRCSANDSVEFKGDVYSINRDNSSTINIRKRVPGTGVITTVETISSGAGTYTAESRTGLYVVNTGSGPFLVAVFGEPGSSFTRMTRTTDGTTWTHFNLSATLIDNIANLGIRVYRGLLIIPWATTSSLAVRLFIVDVASASASIVIDPGTSGGFFTSGAGGVCACVFKNRLFLLRGSSYDSATNGNSSAALLQELSSGTLVTRATLGTNGGTQIPFTMACLQAIGDTKMVAIFCDSDGSPPAPSNTNLGWRSADITVSGATITPTDTSSTFIPTALRKGVAGLTTAQKGKYGFWSALDDETVPGTPAVFFWLAADTSGAAEYGEYINSASELLTSTTGITPENFAFVTGQGGGEYINTSDNDFFSDGVTVAQGTVPGRVLISARFYGGGGADKFVRGYYNSLENPTMTQMTLVGSATGGSAVRNGNQLEQVTADGSQYTFEWAASTDSQSNGQPENIIVILATV